MVGAALLRAGKSPPSLSRMHVKWVLYLALPCLSGLLNRSIICHGIELEDCGVRLRLVPCVLVVGNFVSTLLKLERCGGICRDCLKFRGLLMVVSIHRPRLRHALTWCALSFFEPNGLDCWRVL